jgi:Arc/MetJ family transcription regulator
MSMATVQVDDELLSKAMAETNAATPEEAVREALVRLIPVHKPVDGALIERIRARARESGASLTTSDILESRDADRK